MRKDARHPNWIWRFAFLVLCQLILIACQTPDATKPPLKDQSPMKKTNPSEEQESEAAAQAGAAMNNLIPKPAEVKPGGDLFTLTAAANIYVDPATDELTAIGQTLADRLNHSTGFHLRVLPAAGILEKGSILLTTSAADADLGDEGYELDISKDAVLLVAPQPAGIFYGTQTLRQLLPPAVEASASRPGPWQFATGTVRDHPRFRWRGTMLDVARHFFQVEDVKHFIDLMAHYKLNRLHLHLSDDQGWRIMIHSWPDLARIGGSKAVNDDPGGYYTQAEYAEIVAYAASRYITVIPEIDMPGHTNAALASYPQLNCDGKAPDLYTGIEVGFSSLCVGKEITYQMIDDVLREIAALTPGPYLHIGGDEASATGPEEYRLFIERVQSIVAAHGKQTIGWEDFARVDLLPGSIAQVWHAQQLEAIRQKGQKVIFSLAPKAYLDMKYDASTPLGLNWAGYIEVEDGYTWDPGDLLSGIAESNILGVEAALWSETLRTPEDIEYMLFPRLPGIAEIGWSPAKGRDWEEYRLRLAAQGLRWEAMGLNFYRSPQVPWEF